MPITSPDCQPSFWQSAINQRFPWPPPQVQLIFQSSSKNSGKHLLYQVIRGYDKGHRWQPDEETQRVRSGGPWAQEPLPAWSWNSRCSQCTVCSPPWKSSKPHTIGIFMEVLPRRHDKLLTPFSTHHSSQEDGGVGGTGNSKLLIRAWSFPWAAPSRSHQESTQSGFIRTRHSHHLGNCKSPGALCQEPGAKAKY